MADENTPAAPAAEISGSPGGPPVNIPTPSTERLSVPASALLDFDPKVELKAETKKLVVSDPTAEAHRKAEADREAAEKTAADKVAADVKKVEDDKAAAAEAAKKAEADKNKPAAPAPEAKVKLGEKEYTHAELLAALAKKAEAEKAAPVQNTPAPVAPTPEQLAAQKAEQSQKEQEWVTNFAKNIEQAPTWSTDEMETLLSGGKDSIALLDAKMKQLAATAVLQARKTIYSDMNPALARVESAIAPLLQNSQQLEKHATAQLFLQRHPEFQPHAQTAQRVGDALVQNFPEEVSKMTRDQFIAEVAAQTDRILQSEYSNWDKSGKNWREASKAAAPAAAPAAATPGAQPAAAKPAEVRAQPLAINAPAATSAAGKPADFHKTVAHSLRE